MAPEVLVGKYDEKCDIWSCGVILYILLCGYPPINCRSEKELIERVKQGKYEFDPLEWDVVSDFAKDLIKKTMEKDPEKRLSAIQALNHPWIQQRRKSNLLIESNSNTTLKALNNLKSYSVFIY